MKEKLEAFWDEHSYAIKAGVAIGLWGLVACLYGYKYGILVDQCAGWQAIAEAYRKQLEESSK